jgi:hypothetical protein
MLRKSLLFILALLLVPTMALAVGSWAAPVPVGDPTSPIKTITFTWIGDSAAGTVPAYVIPAASLAFMKNYYIYVVETDPGTPAPTTLYDITITNAGARDVLGGAGADRSATLQEVVLPKFDATNNLYVPLDGTALTINVAATTVNSATAYIKLWLAK